jgi:hypothetical protein
MSLSYPRWSDDKWRIESGWNPDLRVTAGPHDKSKALKMYVIARRHEEIQDWHDMGMLEKEAIFHAMGNEGKERWKTTTR